MIVNRSAETESRPFCWAAQGRTITPIRKVTVVPRTNSQGAMIGGRFTRMPTICATTAPTPMTRLASELTGSQTCAP